MTDYCLQCTNFEVFSLSKRHQRHEGTAGNYSRIFIDWQLKYLVSKQTELETQIFYLENQLRSPEYKRVVQFERRSDTIGRIIAFVARLFLGYGDKLDHLNRLTKEIFSKKLGLKNTTERLSQHIKKAQKFYELIETFHGIKEDFFSLDRFDFMGCERRSPYRNPSEFLWNGKKTLEDIAYVSCVISEKKALLQKQVRDVLLLKPIDYDALNRLYDPRYNPLKDQLNRWQNYLEQLTDSAEDLSRTCVEKGEFGGMATYKKLPLFHLIKQDEMANSVASYPVYDTLSLLERYLSRAHTFNPQKGLIATTTSLQDGVF